jgi:hypothetical protein
VTLSAKQFRYRVVSEQAVRQRGTLVTERLRETIGRVIGSAAGFRVLEWAGEDATLADRPDTTVAVLSPRFCVGPTSDNGPAGAEAVIELWKHAGGGFRQWRNALLLVAPDRELWGRAEEAMRQVMGYEDVMSDLEKGRIPEVSAQEKRDLQARFKDQKESLETSLVTAYRWVFSPGERDLKHLTLSVPAVKGEKIVSRTVSRLSDQSYGQPKILDRMGAIYFNAKLAPHLWKDEDSPLELAELSRRFHQWTYLPILPVRDRALVECVRDGLRQGLWAVAIGDSGTGVYRDLIERPEQLEQYPNLFDGFASLVRGTLRDLIREELARHLDPGTDPGPVVVPGGNGQTGGETGPEPDPQPTPGPPTIRPAQRYRTVTIKVPKLPISKAQSLQPYLFKGLQEKDVDAEITLTIRVSSQAGIDEETLNGRIVEGLDMLNIPVDWEPE